MFHLNAHIYRSYPCPGSIAMTAFIQASQFCAMFRSSWCSFMSLHRSLSLPRGIFPPTFIVVTCFATFVSSLLITWPYHERRFWVTRGDWLDHCIAPELFISDFVFPCFALKPSWHFHLIMLNLFSHLATYPVGTIDVVFLP